MVDTIKDGKGSGYLAQVTKENALFVSGWTENAALHTAQNEGLYYATLFSGQAAAPGNVIGYFKNTSTIDVIIDFFTVYSTASAQVHVFLGQTGTPGSGSDVVPGNVVAGSAKTATGTFQEGTGITGLSNGTNVFVGVSPAGETAKFDFMPIIVPPNQTLTFKCFEVTTTTYIGVGFYYHDTDN